MGLFDFLSSGSKGNPASSAMPYLNKIPGVGEQYYSPYVNRGEQASQQAGDVYSRLAMDPQAFLEQIMSGYKPTEGYKYRSKIAQDAAHNAAAAGGYAGGEYDQRQRAELANSLASQDMQQYIQNILGLQGAGLQGLQHQGDYGYQASSGLADYLGNAYGNQAQTAYAGKAQRLANQGNLFGGILGAAGQGLGAYFGKPGVKGQQPYQGSTYQNPLYPQQMPQNYVSRPGKGWLGYGG